MITIVRISFRFGRAPGCHSHGILDSQTSREIGVRSQRKLKSTWLAHRNCSRVGLILHQDPRCADKTECHEIERKRW